jgi:tRNA(fMet)-specific endonuclease VapC
MYLLDTNIFSHIYKKNNGVLIKKIVQINESQIAICSVVLAELIFGAFNNPANTSELLQYYGEVSKALICFDFDKKAGVIFGELKAGNKKSGKNIEDMDVMVASVCLANDLVLVTNNVKHFNNIPNLKIENWTTDE